jgi:hypothetical protein
LEFGQFTPLDKLWLKNVKKILKKAILNSITQIRLVRLSKTNYVGNQTMTFKNSNENVIYEAVTETNYSSYLVTLDQINDILATATSSLRAPSEHPESFQRAFSS